MISALLLARAGVRVLIVERRPEPHGAPRAVHLDDESLRVLQAVGVAEGFAAISRPALGMRLLDRRHRVMAELRRDGTGLHGHPRANMFDQPDLEELLRSAVLDQPLVCVRRRCTVVGIEPDGVRVQVTLDDDGDRTTLSTRAVLGCDGAGSAVRRLLGIALRELGAADRWLVLDVRSAQQLPTRAGVQQVCDPARAVTFMQVGADRYRWEVRLADGETAADLAAPAQLAGLLAPWHAEVTSAALQVLRAAEYTFRAQVATRWRDGRVFLLGDAAHLTPPFVGQGLGAGVRDAANLSWKLARVLVGTSPEDLLDTYEAERAPQAVATIRLAQLVGWAMTGGGGGVAALRRAVLTTAVRVPGMARLPLATRPPALRRGPLVRRSRLTPWSRVGHPLPQPTVTVDGRPVPLDEVLGSSFALVTRAAPGPRACQLARDIDARIVQVAAAGGGRSVTDHTGVLLRWLERGRCEAVLVRPDRIVLAAGRVEGLHRAVRRLPISMSQDR